MSSAKSSWRISSAIIAFSALYILSGSSFAAEKVFVKEYAYQSGAADDKHTSRAIAAERAKRLVIEEFGAHLMSKTMLKGIAAAGDKITVLAAGVVQTEIFGERWDGKNYYLKARITADPEATAKAIDKLRKDPGMTRQLGDAKRRADEALKEIEKFKSGFDASKKERSKELAYAKQVDVLSATDWFFKGVAYNYSKKNDRAIDAYSKAVGLDPSYSYAYNNRGSVYAAKGRHALAIEDFDKAISLKPDDPYAYYNRGNARGVKAEFDKAAEDFTKAISLKHDYAEAYNNRGAVHGMKGRLDAALEDFTKAISLKSDYAEAYYNRATAHGRKGRHDMAIEDYNWAISLQPDYLAAYYYRGNAYSAKGLYDKAIADHGKVISLKPDFALAYNERGHAYNMKGQHDKALADFKKGCGLGNDLACKNVKVVQEKR